MGPEVNPERSAGERPDGEHLSTFHPGTNVLVRGPTLSGKRSLALGLLAGCSDREQPVVLSAATDSRTLRRRLATAENPALGDRCFVVDALRSQVSGGTIACTDGGDRRTWYVTSPSNLTALGMATSKALSAVRRDGDRPRIVVDSLSTLLQYNSLERVYRFLHVMNGRMSAMGGVTIQVIHSDAHTKREAATLGHLFDTVFDVTEKAAATAGEEVVTVLTDESRTSFALSDVLSTLTGTKTPPKP